MPLLEREDFTWLPTERSCHCEPERLNCLTRAETYELGSTVLNVNRRQVWKERHPARFIPELPQKYIRLFSHRGETVLDPFCGSGTTNIVAAQLERHSIGIDVNPPSIQLSRKRLQDFVDGETNHLFICEDCRRTLSSIPEGTIDLVVTSPPYFDVVDYSQNDLSQLGNIHDYRLFLEGMEESFQGIFRVLKEGGYAVINTQDLFKKDAKCPIHSDYVNIARDLGFELININIYMLNYSTGGRLVFGYPKSYYPKNDHEYVVILRKAEA